MKIRNIYLGSLSALAVLTSFTVSANEGVYVPELDGGVTGSVGVFIATPSSATVNRIDQDGNQIDPANVTPGYNAGIDASLGYIFEDTANGVEVFFRNYDNSDSSDVTTTLGGESLTGTENIGYELNTFDLMISQFMNIGQHMQMRFSAGASYAEIEQNQTGYINEFDTEINQSSEFRGWGPRLAIDARYDFGNDIEGLGVVAGGSVAYFLGELEGSSAQINVGLPPEVGQLNNDLESQSVTNLRGNVGVDYVYFFDNDEGSTLGIELGYQVDYYADAAVFSQSTGSTSVTNTQSISFSGPYAYLKGVF